MDGRRPPYRRDALRGGVVRMVDLKKGYDCNNTDSLDLNLYFSHDPRIKTFLLLKVFKITFLKILRVINNFTEDFIRTNTPLSYRNYTFSY